MIWKARETRCAYATVLPEVVLYRPASTPFVGFKNYLDIVRGDFFATAWGHTLTFTLFAVALATILGFGVAHLLRVRSRIASFLNAAVLLPHIWKELPLTSILYVAALQAIPDELYDAARADGAGVLATLRRITIPLVLPTTL